MSTPQHISMFGWVKDRDVQDTLRNLDDQIRSLKAVNSQLLGRVRHIESYLKDLSTPAIEDKELDPATLCSQCVQDPCECDTEGAMTETTVDTTQETFGRRRG